MPPFPIVATLKVPALIVVAPVKVFAPDKTKLPLPILFIEWLPLTTELIVNVEPKPILKLPEYVNIKFNTPEPEPEFGPCIVKFGGVEALYRYKISSDVVEKEFVKDDAAPNEKLLAADVPVAFEIVYALLFVTLSERITLLVAVIVKLVPDVVNLTSSELDGNPLGS